MIGKLKSKLKEHAPGAVKGTLKNTIPGAGAVLNVADKARQHIQSRKNQEEKMTPFQSKDADDIGLAKYPHATPAYRGTTTVRDAQQYLCDNGYLSSPADVDGCVGPGTLRAISEYERVTGEDFYRAKWVDPGYEPPVRDAAELFMLSPRVRHTSQAAPGVGEILIPGLTADRKAPLNKPVSRIGCASLGIVSVWDFFSETDIDFADGIRALIIRGCYNDDRDLIWGRAVSLISEDCELPFTHEPIARYAAQNWIKDGLPVLCHAGRGHWVVGVGYGDDLGVVYNDPATQFGDGYDDPVRNSELQGTKNYTFDRYIVICPV